MLNKEEKQALFSLLREVLKLFVQDIIEVIKEKREEKKNGKKSK